MRVESYELDTGARELHRGGERIRLQAQPFEILQMMLARPGEVVTREELVKRLWPDGTFVDFEHSLNAAVRRLRSALGDDAISPRFIETLPRRGYRWVAPCERSAAAVESEPRARVAVLPFIDGGRHVSPCGFSEGLRDETIVQLGQLDALGVDVIARVSSTTFKSGECRAKDIGATLRADYLLEGRVRHQGDRVRIAAWLVWTVDETQMWADVYDRCLADALSVQAEVASRIVGSLASEIPIRVPASQ